jgi:prepilin-type N-terminal cleavage/methylation domain-containing protein
MFIFHQEGFSLIEVLIALVLLSIVLIGLDASELSSLRESKYSYYYSVAVNQLQSIQQQILVYKDSTQDISANWNNQNKLVLLYGRGVISGSYPDYKISIFWGDTTLQSCEKIQIGQSGCITN